MRYLIKINEVEAICMDSEERVNAIGKMLGDHLIVNQQPGCDYVGYWLRYEFGEKRINWGDYVVKDSCGSFHVFSPSDFNANFIPADAEKTDTITVKYTVWGTTHGVFEGKEYFTWDQALVLAEKMCNKLPSVEDVKEAIKIGIEISLSERRAVLSNAIEIPFNGYGWSLGGGYSLLCDRTHGFIWTSDIYDENNAMAFMCTANSWGFCAIPKNSKCNVILCEK